MLITGDTVLLRPWQPTDAHALADLCDDEEIVRWTRVPAHYTLEHAQARLAEVEPAGQVRLAVCAHGVVVAAIDLRRVEDHRAEIGYLAHRAHRGRGYITEAVRLLTTFGHERFRRIEILVDPDNPASGAVAARAGYELEGTLRGYRVDPPRSGDRQMWASVRGRRA